jgi:formyltetrahydrofolate-dependent phosphoribosylglycinamide formyltransferase
MNTDTHPIRMVVLISGGGRTLVNFIDLIRHGQLPATIDLVIASRHDAAGLARAAEAGIPTTVIARKGVSAEKFSEQITDAIDAVNPDLVCLAGFMCFYRIPDRYIGRVMNIHPALLPAFGGQGMYGHHVHEAVIDSGVKITGCTVHFADNEYDHGPIIVQQAVEVADSDDADSLAGKVFEAEKIAYPQAIQMFASGRLRIVGRRVVQV